MGLVLSGAPLMKPGGQFKISKIVTLRNYCYILPNQLFIELYSWSKIQRKIVKWNLKKISSETVWKPAAYRPQPVVIATDTVNTQNRIWVSSLIGKETFSMFHLSSKKTKTVLTPLAQT